MPYKQLKDHKGVIYALDYLLETAEDNLKGRFVKADAELVRDLRKMLEPARKQARHIIDEKRWDEDPPKRGTK